MNFILKTKISELPEIDKISMVDCFAVSKPDETNELDLSSYKITANKFDDSLIHSIETLSSANPLGIFDFTDSKYETALINGEKDQLSLGIDVPTIEIAKYYDDLITKLSLLVYSFPDPSFLDEPLLSDFHYPSYKGQILIFRDLTFETEEELQKIYGKHTRWKKISGRFLIGAGSNPGKNKTDRFGSIKTSFVIKSKQKDGELKSVIDDIPLHSHSFNGVNYGKFPSFPRSESEKFKMKYTKKEDGDKSKAETGNPNISQDKHIDFSDYMWKKNSLLDAVINRVSFIAESGKTSYANKFKVAGEIKDCETENEAHDNLPPCITANIWERIE